MARAYSNYSRTGQMAPIPGRENQMVKNNAGGFGFLLDDWERLHRFLILGSEGGTYYVGQAKLTEENAQCVIRCLLKDGVRTVQEAYDVNINNRAPKVDQQLFVMALALKHGDQATKNAVAGAMPEMLRTGTHLLHFVDMINHIGGWNRTKRRIVANVFLDKGIDRLAYQVLKYQQRDGWHMRDVLRMAHPKPIDKERDDLFNWVIGGEAARENRMLPTIIEAYDAINTGLATTGNLVASAVNMILAGLPREALPTEALRDTAIWRLLLEGMPPHALLRNLGTMTAREVFAGEGSRSAIARVVEKLSDPVALRKSRLHPFAIMLALLVYSGGKGLRGSNVWQPVRPIVEALERAYALAFEYAEPTNKRLLVAMDVSGSMSTEDCQGTPLKAHQASAAIALTMGRLEPYATIVSFDTEVKAQATITERTRLQDMMAADGGGTDLSAPIRWALGHRSTVIRGRYQEATHQFFDGILILTDNETWAGRYHASTILEQYREKINPACKMICASMAANHANIVDPTDQLSMGCAGLDSNLPMLIREFLGCGPLLAIEDDTAED